MNNRTFTRAQAEWIGEMRVQFHKEITDYLTHPSHLNQDDIYIPTNHNHLEFENDEDYRRAAELVACRHLEPYEEYHMIQRIPGYHEVDWFVPLCNHESHERLHHFDPKKDHLNLKPDGTYEVSDRELKPIVNVVLL